MPEPEHIHVKIGEVKTGRGRTVLKTTLGSCVGICLVWKERNHFGLAHCLLPELPAPTSQIGAKYVDQAVPSLLAMMKAKPADYPRIKAIVVGGGNMISAKQGEQEHIGTMNAKAAIRTLKALGIHVAHQETGGEEATQFSIDCATGEYTVSRIAKRPAK